MHTFRIWLTESTAVETYHGTSLEVAKLIKTQGLKPGKWSGRLYVSTGLDLAFNYAIQSSQKGIVAVVVLRKEALAYLHPEPKEHGGADRSEGTYYEGTKRVPPKFIKEIRLYKAAEIHARPGTFPFQHTPKPLKYTLL